MRVGLVALASVAAALAACGTSDDRPPSPLDASTDAAPPDALGVTPPDGAGAEDATAAGDATSDGGPPSRAPQDHGRADRALESLLLHYWRGGSAYFGESFPDDGKTTGYWTFAQALDAVADGVARTGGDKYAGMLGTLFAAQDAIGWQRDFFDDESWMALALLHAFDFSHDPRYLNRANALLQDIATAWDSTCCGAHPGGLWWDRAHTQKATAANAGAAITAVRLFARTGDGSLLTFAQQVFDFWASTMIDPVTHQVADHVDTGGTRSWWKLTYNEGLMIGAAVELHRATGDARYLAVAHQIASFMVSSETTHTPDGDVLFDGASCDGDCQQFKGIGHRYLSTLHQMDPRPEYAALLTADADAIWGRARDGATDTFGVDWSKSSTPPTSIDAQSSATMALQVFAAAEAPYAGTLAPANLYEAEDGVLHGVGLEATHTGYSGWGYLAGWNADGQWVDFVVTVPTAGDYDLALRYAAGAGDAARLVHVNGANAVDAQKLPATASWDTYATAHAPVTLKAGANTVSIIFDGSLGSRGYLNLDAISVSPSGSCATTPPPAATPLSPGNETSICDKQTFCWTASPGASSYDLVLGGHVVCSTSATCCDTTIGDTTEFEWHVVAHDGCASTVGPRAHVIIGEAVDAPSSPSPSDGGGLRGATPVLSWGFVPGAYAYDVAIDGVVTCARIATNECALFEDVPSGVHTWSVTAYGGCGTASATWTFVR